MKKKSWCLVAVFDYYDDYTQENEEWVNINYRRGE